MRSTFPLLYLPHSQFKYYSNNNWIILTEERFYTYKTIHAKNRSDFRCPIFLHQICDWFWDFNELSPANLSHPLNLYKTYTETRKWKMGGIQSLPNLFSTSCRKTAKWITRKKFFLMNQLWMNSERGIPIGVRVSGPCIHFWCLSVSNI